METLEVGDLDPGYAVEAVRAARPGDARRVTAPGPQDVPLLVRPLVWLLALVVLPLRAAGRGGERLLEAYEHGADTAGRAALRACRALGRALVRVLGPLGRLLRRLLVPAWRLVLRVWDRAQVWLMLELFRPLGRLGRWALARCRPVVARLLGWGRALVARLEPVTEALARAVLAVDRTADRLGGRVRRAWEPVGRAVTALTRGHR